jgi:hypothetical protein
MGMGIMDKMGNNQLEKLEGMSTLIIMQQTLSIKITTSMMPLLEAMELINNHQLTYKPALNL